MQLIHCKISACYRVSTKIIGQELLGESKTMGIFLSSGINICKIAFQEATLGYINSIKYFK